MKTTKTTRSLILTLILVLSAFAGFAQEASKTINKSFMVNKDATLSVDNRFGKIHCNVWDKNEITIEVKITATAPNQKLAEQMLANVNVDISGNASKVTAVTSMQSNTSSSGKTSINIDYTINMPRTLNLQLSNKFGDIYLDENSRSSQILLEYGNLQVNNLTGKDHQLTMKFSKGRLGKAENLNLDMGYSELTCNEITDLVIDSKFSTFEIENVGSIRHDSQYDTNRFGDSESFTSVAKFSTINIGSVSELLDLDVRYGGCTVKEIGSGFSYVVVNNSFGNVDLRFDPEISFTLDAESSFGEVSVPHSSKVVVEEVSFTGKTYKGSVGKEGKSTQKVTITTRNGDVNLKLK
jgi:hypothetical protein